MGDPLERLGSETAMGLESTIKEELCMEIDPPFKENVVTAEDWRKALNKVVPAVVVLRTTACRAFDTEPAGASYATGFVVDKRRGIILTNRHVVKPGPVVAETMFVNRKEITVHPIYRDPVHDFGFFHYNPDAIQFLDYEEIPLAPEAACVGLEIRVVGNDSGEKVSIVAGTLALLDRDAPLIKSHSSPSTLTSAIIMLMLYTCCMSVMDVDMLICCRDGYNDFNTFYMQAASGTKGGSSGSPVIDWQGRAVALNAGSKSSSSSAFFLPLERVVRALKFLQKGGDSYMSKWEAVSIPRGTLQATFLHKGFDEIRRLGLQSETEQMARHASAQGETGMLVVDSVVPGGPAHNHLEPGDVLVRVNGEVQDLHSITPAHFLEVSGAVIHPVLPADYLFAFILMLFEDSTAVADRQFDLFCCYLKQARNFRFQCGLVYVSEPGYMLFRAVVPRHAIIKKFAGEEISKLEDLISVLSKLSRVARSVLVTVDRHEWYAAPQIYTRDDSSGLWTAAPAFQTESMLPSSGINGETTHMEHIHQDNHQVLTDGVTSMETSCEHASAELHSQDETGIGLKKRRVEEDMSSYGVVSDCSSNENGEIKSENKTATENAVLRDYQGAAANASIAERVIEPTLVMFEATIFC
ncbi:hypothetical protein CRYUN_Cryun23aG0021300 [Craigia yunnanensis]